MEQLVGRVAAVPCRRPAVGEMLPHEREKLNDAVSCPRVVHARARSPGCPLHPRWRVRVWATGGQRCLTKPAVVGEKARQGDFAKEKTHFKASCEAEARCIKG